MAKVESVEDVPWFDAFLAMVQLTDVKWLQERPLATKLETGVEKTRQLSKLFWVVKYHLAKKIILCVISLS
jgi:hypothetical protein